MDAVQKEHERLLKKLKSSQTIQDVQSTIDALQSARDTIASGRFADFTVNYIGGILLGLMH